MITGVMANNELHAVHVIHQKGMTTISARGYCGAEGNASQGVYQVPEWAFDGRAKYGAKSEITVCTKCVATVALMKVPPK